MDSLPALPAEAKGTVVIADSRNIQGEHQAVANGHSLDWRARWQTDALRIGLVPLFVVFCYQFDWQAWRELVCSAFLTAAPWFGVTAVRAEFDSFACQGQFYRFVIACTALDAFFGSIPLLWNHRATIFRNLVFLSAYFLCLSMLNLVRLEFGLMLYLKGMSWSLSHQAMAGVFYFGLFLWIARQRRWS
jgi:hypothetical protein